MTESNNAPQGLRLSKEERKRLLADLERSSSRSEPPERVLQRAQQALSAGNLAQARRLADQLASAEPSVTGLDHLRQQLDTAERSHKQRENVRTAEEMLTRYIQQRKKSLAELALSTLEEIVPQHPRLPEYRIWVGDLDQEMALQERLEALVADGRDALARGDFKAARRQLEALEKLDPYAAAVEQFAAEVSSAEEEEAESADIVRLKERFEQLLEAKEVIAAREVLDQLSDLDVPKVTLELYSKRLAVVAQQLRDEAEAQELESHFEQAVAAKNWQGAREIARRYGDRFPSSSHAAELYNRVNQLEAGERRQHSKAQGVAALEQFIAQGKRHDAEVALKLLRGMDLDPAQLAELEARVKALG